MSVRGGSGNVWCFLTASRCWKPLAHHPSVNADVQASSPAYFCRVLLAVTGVGNVTVASQRTADTFPMEDLRPAVLGRDGTLWEITGTNSEGALDWVSLFEGRGVPEVAGRVPDA